MDGATLTTLSAVLKDQYEPALQDQLNTDNPLLREIEATDQASFEGNAVVIGARIGRNTSGAGAAEGATLPAADHRKYARLVYDVTYHYSAGEVTGPATARTRSSVGSFVQALQDELDGVREAASQQTARKVWTPFHGAFATIATGGVSGTGPWTLTLTNARALTAGWVEEGMRLHLTSAPSGGAVTVQDSSAVLRVTDVDEDGPTVTVEQVSGTSTPAAGERLCVAGDANRALNGLEQIMDPTATVGDLSPSAQPLWKPQIDANGGSARTLTVDLCKKMRNKIKVKSGKTTDAIILRPGLARVLYNELKSSVRYNSPDELKAGDGISIDGIGKVIEDHQAVAGQVQFIRRADLKVYHTGDWHFLNQGGSNLLMLERADKVEFILARYFQLAALRRNSMGQIQDLTDTSAY